MQWHERTHHVCLEVWAFGWAAGAMKAYLEKFGHDTQLGTDFQAASAALADFMYQVRAPQNNPAREEKARRERRGMKGSQQWATIADKPSVLEAQFWEMPSAKL